MRPVDQSILARIPANDGNVPASMASASAHRERKAAPVQCAIVAVRGGFGLRKAISRGRLASFRGPVLAPGSPFIMNEPKLSEFRTAAYAPWMTLAALKMRALFAARTISHNGVDLCEE